MVIDPRGRIRRSRFLYDLIMPNILAAIAIGILAGIEGPLSTAGVGALSLLLLWSANFAAPIARLHDLGVSGWVHPAILAVVFLTTIIGPVGGFGEVVLRVADWAEVLRGNGSQLPPIEGEAARIGGLVALAEIGILAFMKGQPGANRFGPDPKVT
jgi:uncharacterized membrane protein YhaH (DUF805 family)